MPPPNANGRLHAGHTLFITLEDIMTRYNNNDEQKASLGAIYSNHAGFETPIVYQKNYKNPRLMGVDRFGIHPIQTISIRSF